MVRRFRYKARPEEVRDFVTSLGYQTEDMYYPDGEKPFGFRVQGTTVQLSYDSVIQHPVTGDLMTVGFGTISLNNNSLAEDYSQDKAEQSLKLYGRLYRRFSKQTPQEK